MSTALRTLIRAVLNETELADPEAVAAEAFAQIEPGDYAAMLSEAIRDVCQVEITRHRMAAAKPPKAPGSSGFVRGLPAALLRSRHCVAGQWKLYGECTPADLRILADQARRRAAEMLGVAQRHEQYAAAVEAAGAATLADYFAAREAAA